MKKAMLFVCVCLCFAVGYAKQNKIEIGFKYGEDCIIYHLTSYYWGAENYGFYFENFSPRTINVFSTVPLNNNIRIGTKIGYSNIVRIEYYGLTAIKRIHLNGGYFDVLGLINIPLIKEKLSIYSVISPSFRYYEANHNDSIINQSPSVMQLKSKIFGFVQTLSLGLNFAVSKSIELTTEIEKPLINLMVSRGYTGDQSYYYDGYPYTNGFADIGITMGLTFLL